MPFTAAMLLDVGDAAAVLDHRIDAGTNFCGIGRRGAKTVALAAKAPHALRLVARAAHRFRNQLGRGSHGDHDARRAVIEEPRHQLQLLLRDAHDHRHAERIEELDAAESRAEVPRAVL